VRAPTLVAVAAAAALVVATPASARTAGGVEVIASGLDNPRHVAVAPGGDVYVAESGRGGDPATATSCFDSAEGPSCTGATGAVTRISRDGGQERIVTGLASFAPATGANAIGPHGVFATRHGKLLVTNGGPTAPTRGDPPVPVLRDPTLVDEDPVSALYGTLLKVRKDGEHKQVADIWRFEHDHNPDAIEGNPLVDSNPVDVLADDGSYVVADAGGNTILRASRDGRIEVVALFPNVDTPSPMGIIPMNAVPTGVVKGPDGAYYVSQLTGFPFPVGGAKVFRVDPETGEHTTYADGFTNGMDLAFAPDGTLYLLEIDRDSLLAPGLEGGLWAVPPGGGTPAWVELPAGTLIEPGGIDVDRHGTLFVSNHAREAGNGEVLKIELGG
jgi:hypothetical protein